MRKLLKSMFYFVLGLIPKNKNKIVLESHPDLSDNAMAVYEYLQKNGKRKYKYVWFVDDPKKFESLGYENTIFVSLRNQFSFAYMYHVITSKYIMFCNREIRWVDLKKQVVVSLTHGLPLKSCVGLLPADTTFNYLVSSSDEISPYQAKEFVTSVDKCIVTGLPRNDDLFKKDENVEKVVGGFDKFIIWLPTYKKHKNVNIVDSEKYKDKVVPLFEDEELVALNETLKAKNILLMLKFHPAQDLSSFKGSDYSNILFWKNEDLVARNLSLYKTIGYADALITDYSSVGCDYLLLNRPIAYVQDDKSEYENNRGFSFENVDEKCPGNKIKTKFDFVMFIEEIYNGIDYFEKDRKKVLDFYHTYQDGYSTKRLVDYFEL